MMTIPLKRIFLILAALALLTAAALAFWARPYSTPHDIALPPAPLPDRPIKLAVMGTSLTARGTWPETLAEKLSTCLNHPVTLIREAKAGETSAWGLTRTAAIIEATPDILLIEFAINDADLKKGATPWTSRARHNKILSELRAGTPETAITLMSMSHAHGMRRLMRPALPAYYRSYRQLAARHQTGLIDLYPDWRASGLRFADGLHPTNAMQEDIMLPRILPILGVYFDQPCS